MTVFLRIQKRFAAIANSRFGVATIGRSHLYKFSLAIQYFLRITCMCARFRLHFESGHFWINDYSNSIFRILDSVHWMSSIWTLRSIGMWPICHMQMLLPYFHSGSTATLAMMIRRYMQLIHHDNSRTWGALGYVQHKQRMTMHSSIHPRSTHSSMLHVYCSTMRYDMKLNSDLFLAIANYSVGFIHLERRHVWNRIWKLQSHGHIPVVNHANWFFSISLRKHWNEFAQLHFFRSHFFNPWSRCKRMTKIESKYSYWRRMENISDAQKIQLKCVCFTKSQVLHYFGGILHVLKTITYGTKFKSPVILYCCRKYSIPA